MSQDYYYYVKIKVKFDTEKEVTNFRYDVLKNREQTSPGTYNYILWFEKDDKGIQMERAREISYTENQCIVQGNILHFKYKELSKYLNTFLDRFEPPFRSIEFSRVG